MASRSSLGSGGRRASWIVAVQAGEFGVEGGQFLRGHRGEFGIGVAPGEFGVFLALVGRLAAGFPAFEQRFELRVLAHRGAGALGLVEDRGVGDGVVQFTETLDLFGDDRAEVHRVGKMAGGNAAKQNGGNASKALPPLQKSGWRN